MTDPEIVQLVQTALRDCYHPTLRRNVMDLNLLRHLAASRDAEAPGAGIAGVPARYVVHMQLTGPSNDDAANAQFAAQVENRLLGLEAISRVELTLLPSLFAIL